ncbi:MAG: hypothetical protein HQ464_02235 [Planctomycetes bacterium]|nr:hypothetical protein [Planctomycetota bacterium]
MSRKKDAIPVVRSHRGLARVRLDGREFYLGRFGSPEARAKADRLIAAWLAHGRRLPVEEPQPASPPALPRPADAPVVVEVPPVAPVKVSSDDAEPAGETVTPAPLAARNVPAAAAGDAESVAVSDFESRSVNGFMSQRSGVGLPIVVINAIGTSTIVAPPR